MNKRTMKGFFPICIALGIVFICLPFFVSGEEQNTTAFVNVNVIPMDKERVLQNQTVIVKGDRIVAIGPMNEVDFPAGAEVIDGKGAYMMPGLADMHTHLELRDKDPRSLILYLAEGTTTVRDMAGQQMNLEWRDKVASGEMFGPTILTAGKIILGMESDMLGYHPLIHIFRIVMLLLPVIIGALVYAGFLKYGKLQRWEMDWAKRRSTVLVGLIVLIFFGVFSFVSKIPSFDVVWQVIDGRPGFLAEDVGQVIAEVQREQAAGFDLIKPYDSLTTEQFLALVNESKRLGIYVAGHHPDQMKIEAFMTSGIQEIAHLDELNFFHWNGIPWEEGFKMEYSRIPRTVQLMKDNNVNIVFNVSLDEVIYEMIFDMRGVLAQSRFRVVRPELLNNWRTNGRPLSPEWQKQGPYRRDIEAPFFKELIRSIHEAGIIITIATDTGILTEGSLPSNIHRELELLVESGFSNFDALRAGTVNAASIVKLMGRDGNFGTVAKGQRADLILLVGNPLENVSHTRDRRGVMTRGKWHTQAELDKMVDEFIASY